ncbi:MAG: acyltransferase family protein [Methylococcales bacterium]
MLVNIQFLRFIAAVLVVILHASAHYDAAGSDTWENPFTYIRQVGYAGVDIFFVISGLIIWKSTEHSTGVKGVLDFAYRRATRIYLGYWPYFLMVLTFLYFAAPQRLMKLDVPGSFLLTQPSIDKMLLAVSWTLRFELYFYICFSVLLLLLPRKAIIYTLASVAMVIVGAQLWAVFVEHAYDKKKYLSSSIAYQFYLSPFCLEFISGCFAGFYLDKNRVNNLVAVFVPAFLFFILAIWYQRQYIDGLLAEGYYAPQRVLFFGVVSLFTVIGLVEMEKRGIILCRRYSLLLGGASYSIYLSHPIILIFLMQERLGVKAALLKHGEWQAVWMASIIMLVILYSVWHYRAIEQPIMSAARNFNRRLLDRYERSKRRPGYSQSIH